MSKRKFVVVTALAVAMVAWIAGASNVNSGIVDPANSSASSGAGCLLVCPQGDGPTIASTGATISVTVMDNTPAPIVGIPAADFWLIGCADALSLCGGSGSINADSTTNASGQTTINGVLAAGGCDTGVKVVVQGALINSCLPIATKSPDRNGDGQVQLIDFSLFKPAFGTNPASDTCFDFNCDGKIDLIDFAQFSAHWQHAC